MARACCILTFDNGTLQNRARQRFRIRLRSFTKIVDLRVDEIRGPEVKVRHNSRAPADAGAMRNPNPDNRGSCSLYGSRPRRHKPPSPSDLRCVVVRDVDHARRHCRHGLASLMLR